MYYTTINRILSQNPCDPGKVKGLAGAIDYDAPVSFKHIYNEIGLQEAIWGIRALDYNAEIQVFGLRCARRVEHFDKTGAAKRQNEALEKYLKGETGEMSEISPPITLEVDNTAVIDERSSGAFFAAIVVGVSHSSGASRAAEVALSIAGEETLKQIEQDFLTTFCGE